MPIVTAKGKEFTFPDGTTPDQMGGAIDEYFASIKPAEPAEGAVDAFSAGAFRGFSALGRGFAQRAFEGALTRAKGRTIEFSEGIESGKIEANEENLAEFDRLIEYQNNLANRLQSSEDIEKGQRQEFAPTKEAFPVAALAGEITGQAIPAVTAGFMAGGGSIPATLGGRMAMGGVAGAATGASQATVDDESVLSNVILGGAFGMAAPPALEKVVAPIVKGATAPVINFFKDVFAKAPSKFKPGAFKSPFAKPKSQEVQDIASAFDDVTQAVEAAPAKTPEQVARVTAFEEAGITPAARSRITRNTDDFQKEGQLLRQRDSSAADKLRDSYFEESEQLQTNVRILAESLGISEKSGQSIKDALDSIQTSMLASTRQGYKDLADIVGTSDPDLVQSIPIGSNQIKDAIDEAQVRFLDDATADRVDRLMAEFGLMGNPIEKMGRFTLVDVGENTPIRVRGDIKPLNIGNLEAFRARVNDLFDPTDVKHSAARGVITSAIDTESDILIEGLEGSSLPKDIINQARIARGLASKKKLVFDQADLVDQLTKIKPGTITPLVEASRVMSKLKSAPPEQVKKLLKTLRGTDEGISAIGNMGSSVVVDLLNAATKATGKQLVGPQGQGLIDFSGSQFKKAIDNFGPTKESSRALLKNILGDQAYKKMIQLEKIGEFRITPESAVQKGSAPDLINQFIRASKLLEKTKLPFAGKVAEIAEAGAQKREAKRLLNIKPDEIDDETKDFILFNAPKLAPIFGLRREEQ